MQVDLGYQWVSGAGENRGETSKDFSLTRERKWYVLENETMVSSANCVLKKLSQKKKGGSLTSLQHNCKGLKCISKMFKVPLQSYIQGTVFIGNGLQAPSIYSWSRATSRYTSQVFNKLFHIPIVPTGSDTGWVTDHGGVQIVLIFSG